MRLFSFPGLVRFSPSGFHLRPLLKKDVGICTELHSRFGLFGCQPCGFTV